MIILIKYKKLETKDSTIKMVKKQKYIKKQSKNQS